MDVLLEVFPNCSMEQAQWVLAKARGDLEEAVQMLVEGKEGPPAWDGHRQVSSATAPPLLASAPYILVSSPCPEPVPSPAGATVPRPCFCSLQDLPRRLRGPQKDELKSFILQK